MARSKINNKKQAMTAEEYFKKWSENARIFKDYKPIHSHKDFLEFAEDYFQQKVNNITDEEIEKGKNEIFGFEVTLKDFNDGAKWFKQQLIK